MCDPVLYLMEISSCVFFSLQILNLNVCHLSITALLDSTLLKNPLIVVIAESDELQMDFFIEALKQNSVDVVKVFLNKIQISKKFMQNLHMGRVLRLYVEVSS